MMFSDIHNSKTWENMGWSGAIHKSSAVFENFDHMTNKSIR